MSEIPKYTVTASSRYKQTRKLAIKRGLDMDLLDWAIDQLSNDIPLPAGWKDHQLKSNLKQFRECHIGGTGDWLLIYEKRGADMVLYLVATGSHADLFE